VKAIEGAREKGEPVTDRVIGSSRATHPRLGVRGFLPASLVTSAA
jgi:hypothetical protein